MACFFINHLHPYSLLSSLISSPFFLHHFVLSFPQKSLISSSSSSSSSPSLPVILSEAYWFSTGALFPPSAVRRRWDRLMSPAMINKFCLPQNSLDYRARTPTNLNAKQMGGREGWSERRDGGRGEGGADLHTYSFWASLGCCKLRLRFIMALVFIYISGSVSFCLFTAIALP